MIVDQPEAAFAAFEKTEFSVSITPVVCLIIPDKAGSLYHALNALNDAAIEWNICMLFRLKKTQPSFYAQPMRKRQPKC